MCTVLCILDDIAGMIDTYLLQDTRMNYTVIEAKCTKNDAAKIWNIVEKSSTQCMIDVAAQQNKSYIKFYEMWINKWYQRLSSKSELFYLVYNTNTNYTVGYIRGGIANHTLESNQWIKPQLIIKQKWIDNLSKTINEMEIDDPWMEEAEENDNQDESKIVDEYDAEIIHFAVSTYFQRIGLGSMLYGALVNGLKNEPQFKDMKNLIVWTWDGNLKGMTFYEQKLNATLIAKRRISDKTVRCAYSLPI